ncbi:MAG: flagellin N-terminal helical domain-containing protein [Salinarimonas sp.]
MALTPFAPGAVDSRRTADMFVQMRKQGADLERQLTTGRRADSYGGLGIKRGQALDLRARISGLESWQQGIKSADTRLKMMLQSIQGLDKIATDTKAVAAMPASKVIPGANPQEQMLAQANLQGAIDFLNAEFGGRSLFAGRAHDERPVANYNTIMQGVGQAIADRATDDGVAGTGLLNVTRAGTTVSIADNGDPDFGFTIAGASSSGGSITAAGAASPASFTVNQSPAVGERVTLTLDLPDGTRREVSLIAETTAGPGQFVTGGSLAQVAENIENAMQDALESEASTSLTAASALLASQGFFDDPANWYSGSDPADPDQARSTATLRIDETQTVGIGAQANEDAFRGLLSQLAAISATDFSDGSTQRLEAMMSRVRDNLTPQGGEQSISQIGMELGVAASTMSEAAERHKATQVMVQNELGDIEDTNTEETVAKLLTLQTRLQASYQTTSLLSRLSLVNFL